MIKLSHVYREVELMCRIFRCGGYGSELEGQLRELGVELISEGPIDLMGLRLIGKGHSSLVYACRVVGLGEIYACKVRRPDSPRPSLIHEAKYLALANTVNVGPRLIKYSKDVIVMELVRGVDIEDFLKVATPQETAAVAYRLLWQGYVLDSIMLAHNELTRLRRHVLVSGGEPRILDFESASMGIRVNVPQLANALFLSGGLISRHVLKVLNPDLKALREALRIYRKVGGFDSFRSVLKALGLG